MHLRKSWLGLSLLAAFGCHAAVIYKWVDADGVTHYSDQASPGAEKIYTSTSSGSAGAAARPAEGLARGPKAPVTSALGYSEFTIISPASDQSFFGDEVISVNLNLVPSLKPRQDIAWHLNGRQLDSPPDAVSLILPRLDRGTYALAATITDQSTGESQSSNSVTFFVRQPSALSPQHK
jgi:hypothetical protein